MERRLVERRLVERRLVELRAMDGRRRLPNSARLLIAAMVAAGTAIVIARLPEAATWTARDLLAWAALSAAIAIAEQFPIPLRHRTETLNFSMTEAVWVGALILARPGILTLAVATGLLVGQTMRRWAAHKVAFNVGQFLVALTVAQVVFDQFGTRVTLDPKAWIAAVSAMACYSLVNASLVALIISRVEGKRLRDVLLPPLKVNALHFAANTAIGLEGVVVWAVSPLGLPLLVVPLILAYVAYRTLVRSLREGDRVRNLIIENASDGILLTSLDHTILSWNPAMERITGFSKDEAIGRNWRDVLCLSESNGENPPEPSGNGHGPDAGTCARILRKNGVEGWIQYSSNTMSTRDGKVSARVLVVHDVTAEREADQLKSDFVATISHELRTPLTPLKGFLSTLLQGTVDASEEARQEYYQIMLKQTNRLERLITDLLEVSRVESAEPLIDCHAVELTAPISEQIRAFLDQHPGRIIRMHVPARPIMVQADPSPLGLVVSNLISNAIKYSAPESPVEVTIAVGQDRAIISVHDHGDGIPVIEQGRIFDRFYQVESGSTRSNGGAGLGLYIARRLVEAMSGRLWVDSEPGRGSTFSFSLPLAQERSAARVAV
jgi:PAS domain S-box-containing protein